MTYDIFKSTYNLRLSPQQETAVQAVEGPTLLLAVPGSGKTTVLVTRLGYMVLCLGIDPRTILTTTYTVAATRDMRERCASIFGQQLADALEFRTINGLSARVIRRCEQMVQMQAFELVTDERLLNEMIGQIYLAITKEYAAESEIKSIRTAITYVKNMMLTDAEVENLKNGIPHFPEIYRAYNTALRSKKCMDYDDQMVYAYRLLKRYPEILQDFQHRYHYFCVDEAQDTSLIQHRIIDLLAGARGNLFMVGDEDQSIYGFRAAYPQALVHFEKEHPGARVLLMTQNYRSTPQIISKADDFIANNRLRHDKHMEATRPVGPEVRNLPIYDRRGQYKYLAAVAEKCNRETAILYRDNDCALPLIDLLARRHLPYRCRQPDGIFFSHRVVRDVTDIIRFAADPRDGECFLRIYYKLGAGIPKTAALNAVRSGDKVHNLMELVSRDPSLSVHSRKTCKALCTHLEELLEEPADKAILRISRRMGYADYLKDRGGDTGKLTILQALGEQESNPLRLLERLQELRAIVLSHVDDPACQLTLSTIHSAKGLEYDRVFLMDIFDGMLPKPADEEADARARLEALEEERRLFYVGMTRAKNELTVFTYEKQELRSSFADLLFPPPADERKPSSDRSFQSETKPRTVPKPSAQLGGDGLTAQALAQLGELLPGRAVRHTFFGGGVIRERKGDVLTIEFDSGRIQMFSAKAALKAHVLTIE
ncbi:MAG: ATP-dependent helicase [Clostridia bacterium]|nr:ATP-dependent helicase [Clostridia bacterium]